MDIRYGALVVLTSGGPLMRAMKRVDQDKWLCAWPNDDGGIEHQTAVFPEESLIPWPLTKGDLAFLKQLRISPR
jgi:uncharacterized protein YodC (DUF2158 family)